MNEPDAGILTPLHPDHIKVTRIVACIFAAIPTIGAAILETAQIVPPGVFLVPVIMLMAWFVIRVPLRRYQHRGYHMGRDQIRIVRGYLFHSDTIVSFGRVQHIDVDQGPLQRRYGLATLTLHTAGNHNSVVSLPGLLHDDAVAMRNTIQVHIRQEML